MRRPLIGLVMRKYTHNRHIFPNDDAALKEMFLAIREASKNWKAIHHWQPALQLPGHVWRGACTTARAVNTAFTQFV